MALPQTTATQRLNVYMLLAALSNKHVYTAAKATNFTRNNKSLRLATGDSFTLSDNIVTKEDGTQLKLSDDQVARLKEKSKLVVQVPKLTTATTLIEVPQLLRDNGWKVPLTDYFQNYNNKFTVYIPLRTPVATALTSILKLLLAHGWIKGSNGFFAQKDSIGLTTNAFTGYGQEQHLEIIVHEGKLAAPTSGVVYTYQQIAESLTNMGIVNVKLVKTKLTCVTTPIKFSFVMSELGWTLEKENKSQATYKRHSNLLTITYGPTCKIVLANAA